VYLLGCGPGGLLTYRRAAGFLAAGETPDAAAGRIGLPPARPERPAATGHAAGDPSSRGGGPALAVHSTSWRHLDDGTIVLTYAVVPDPAPGGTAIPVRSPEIACGGDPLRPSPPHVRHEQVAAHAARHVALIAGTDPQVRMVLERSPELRRALESLAPAPAGQLAG
jgi:hypothetical protein